MKIDQKKTIIAWGGYQYFQENVDMLKKKVEVKYLFANKKYVKDLHGYSLIENKDDILKIKNALVIICLAKIEDVKAASEWCRENSISFTHLDFIVNKFYNVKYISAMGGKYLDSNNNLIISSPNYSDKIFVEAGGAKNSFVNIGRIEAKERLYIKMLGHDGRFCIGDGTTLVSANVIVNSMGRVEIGNDCMFSHTISLMQSDQHLIFDSNTKKRINYSKNIIIGNHVWVGRECEFLGGAEIGDNSICGARAVTSGKFPSNVIIAGCPAKIIRTGVIWARDLVEKNDFTSYDQCSDQKALQYMAEVSNGTEQTSVSCSGDLETMIIKFYRNGMTTSEIAKIIERLYGKYYRSREK